MKKLSVIILLSFATIGCTVVVKTINKHKNKEEMTKYTSISDYANAYFWKKFHEGNYTKIDSILYYLNTAYLENPNHLETVTHLGFTHMWAMSEMKNLDVIPPTIIDHGTLALKYFGESYKLNPNDPRILGFLADAKMAVADISNDKKLSTDGYFNGQKSIHQWKLFNNFTIGYVFSQLDHDSWQYKKALQWQLDVIDDCFCLKFDEKTQQLNQYGPIRDTIKNVKRKRACWDSWIVPHNVEGFYLNLGDMLVKNGEWKKALQIYTLVKKAPHYDTWPFQSVLEKRIAAAEENVLKFRLPSNDKNNHIDDVMLVNSSISCMACHKMSDNDFKKYQNFDWSKFKREENIFWLNK